MGISKANVIHNSKIYRNVKMIVISILLCISILLLLHQSVLPLYGLKTQTLLVGLGCEVVEVVRVGGLGDVVAESGPTVLVGLKLGELLARFGMVHGLVVEGVGLEMIQGLF